VWRLIDGKAQYVHPSVAEIARGDLDKRR